MVRPIQRILVHLKTGKKFPLKDLEEEFHTSLGTIPASELRPSKTIIQSTTKERFLLIKPSFPDLWEELQRGPQVLIQKDIGLILAKTGVNHNSHVVDAGGGSGSLCFSLANVCREVTAYETNAEHFTILEKNKQMLGLKNILLKKKDITTGIDEENLDLITLDLPEPWKVLAQAEKALLPGGFLVVYLPNLLQTKQFVDSTRSSAIKVLETLELLERQWKIEENILRPEFQMLGHTGFMTFCRKLE